MSEVTVVIGAGSIGQAIVRRVSAGKQVLVADLDQPNAEVAAEVLGNAGFEVSAATVDVSRASRCTPSSRRPPGLARSAGSSMPAGCHPARRRRW